MTRKDDNKYKHTTTATSKRAQIRQFNPNTAILRPPIIYMTFCTGTEESPSTFRVLVISTQRRGVNRGRIGGNVLVDEDIAWLDPLSRAYNAFTIKSLATVRCFVGKNAVPALALNAILQMK